MLFSILIPSKNGEKDIENCISSILDQKFDDYEIIIGDNNNGKKFKDILLKYTNYKKIKIISHAKDLEVSENWQSCLNASKGDYIIMLGDDDCLLPKSLENIHSLIKQNDFPDCISVNGIGFYSKGSLINVESSAYKELYFDYKNKGIREGLISKEDRLEVVKKMYNFENKFPLNMQPHIVSRKAISRVKKNIYQPPFPDHYALNALLITAETWLVSYKKIVLVGITNNSFGHYYFNSKTDAGTKYLGLKINFHDEVPGSILHTCMMIWLIKIKKDYDVFLKDVKIPRAEYIQRQFFYIFFQFIKKKIKFMDVINFILNLKFTDKINLVMFIFKFNMIYKGLYKLFNKENKKIILLKNNIDFYSFTRSKDFNVF